MKSNLRINGVLSLASCVALLLVQGSFAQSPPVEGEGEAPLSWQALGFDNLPEGYPSDGIALIDGLNKSRGGWSFEGAESESGVLSPIEGTLEIVGSAKSGMFPSWRFALGWPAEKPERALAYNLLAMPEASGLRLMIVRIGPMDPEAGAERQKTTPKTLFSGSWDLGSRTVTWSKMDPRALLAKQGGEANEASKPIESFTMMVAADGGISIQEPERSGDWQLNAARTVARVGEPFVEEKLAPRDSTYATYAEVTDPRVKRCLPPGAADIVLRSDRGGHFARYKVSGKDFDTFLDGLWEASKGKSAHQRGEMHGEGEAVKPERMAKRFEPLGWKPLEKAVQYYSPSKSSGAMTTYYFDRDTGIAYHDTGYW